MFFFVWRVFFSLLTLLLSCINYVLFTCLYFFNVCSSCFLVIFISFIKFLVITYLKLLICISCSFLPQYVCHSFHFSLDFFLYNYRYFSFLIQVEIFSHFFFDFTKSLFLFSLWKSFYWVIKFHSCIPASSISILIFSRFKFSDDSMYPFYLFLKT